MIAAIFPGQGSQTPDMRDVVEHARPDLLQRVTEAVGADPFEHVDEGTRFQQPAIFCASLAGWELVRWCEPALLAGHSLGELTALVAAGVLSEDDALRLVAARGRLMGEAGELARGGMMATRAPRARVEGLIAGTGACVANDNSPRQVVIAGLDSELDRAEAALAADGVRAKRLPVSGAFHSHAMRPAVEAFRAEVERTELREPDATVISCVTARPHEEVRAALVDGLTSPVLWVDTLRALHDHGARTFVETGPGNVLCGLVRRTLDDAETALAADLEPARG